MKPSRCALMLLAAGLLAVPAGPLAAQALTAGPEIQVARTGPLSNDGMIPALAAGPDGGFLSSWRVRLQALNLRAFSPADAPLASPRELSPGWVEPSQARLAALGAGRFVVVWVQGSSLRGQILDAAGAPVGPHLLLADEATYFSVSAEPGGGFVAAWMKYQPVAPFNAPIKARRFDAQGAPAGGVLETAAKGLVPDVAALPGGGFALAWLHGEPLDPSFVFQVRARAFQADGTPAGPEANVPEPASYDSFVRISADPTGRWVVAWAEAASFPSSERVKAWRFSPAGQPLGFPILVADPEGEGLYYASVGDVAMRPEGSFLVTWGESSVPLGLPSAAFPAGVVRARAFAATGLPLGPAFPVPAHEEGEPREGEAAATPDGWIVAWKQLSAPEAGIYARRFTLSCGSASALCLNGHRFRAEVAWRVPATGQSGVGTPIPRTDDTGAFWFFAPANFELIVKVLDGRGTNGKLWVFYGSLTDVEFDLTVTDTVTGQQRIYHNPAGTLASRADTEAF